MLEAQYGDRIRIRLEEEDAELTRFVPEVKHKCKRGRKPSRHAAKTRYPKKVLRPGT